PIRLALIHEVVEDCGEAAGDWASRYAVDFESGGTLHDQGYGMLEVHYDERTNILTPVVVEGKQEQIGKALVEFLSDEFDDKAKEKLIRSTEQKFGRKIEKVLPDQFNDEDKKKLIDKFKEEFRTTLEEALSDESVDKEEIIEPFKEKFVTILARVLPDEDKRKIIEEIIEAIIKAFEEEFRKALAEVQFDHPIERWVANEYLKFLQRFIVIGGVEGYARRVRFIERATDRHLPLVERTHAIQRRIDHGAAPIRYWLAQLSAKVDYIFFILLDSMNDLALEMEQNARLIERRLDSALAERDGFFGGNGIGSPEPVEGKEDLHMYLQAGGRFRTHIVDLRKRLENSLQRKRDLLDRVGNMVEAVNQRVTNRFLRRIQNYGAAFAVLSLYLGIFNQLVNSDAVSDLNLSEISGAFGAVFGLLLIVYFIWYWPKTWRKMFELIVWVIAGVGICCGLLWWLSFHWKGMAFYKMTGLVFLVPVAGAFVWALGREYLFRQWRMGTSSATLDLVERQQKKDQEKQAEG
ncbi:hypothetical protein D6779_08595, partial [Candidatus Parcubacteria bacterium]